MKVDDIIDGIMQYGYSHGKFDIKSAYRNVPVHSEKHNYFGLNFLLHYLDDFHILGPPNSPICQGPVV